MTNTDPNLEKAQAIRSSGYKTKVHKLPEFKSWFDQEYRNGNKSIQSLREEGIRLFPRDSLHIPSVGRLKNYADKYLSEVVRISPYTPNYIQQIEKFDSYLQMHALAKELLSRYESAKQREQLLKHPDGSFEWVQLYQRHLTTMLDMELKLGLRPFVVSNPIYLQQNNYVQVNNLPAHEEPRKVTDLEIERLSAQVEQIQKRSSSVNQL